MNFPVYRFMFLDNGKVKDVAIHSVNYQEAYKLLRKRFNPVNVKYTLDSRLKPEWLKPDAYLEA